MSQSIFDLIESENWNVIRGRLHSDSGTEASALNSDGMNPLHVAAAQSSAPQDIVYQLIQLNEKALVAKSSSHSLPLHYACESGSVETALILLQYAQTSTSSSISSQLHYYTTYLDINERTPLERAWIAYLCSTSSPKSEDDDEFNEKLSSLEFLELWKKTELILYAASIRNVKDFLSRHNSTNEWYVMHEIAKSGGSDKCWCPSIVIWFALKIGFAFQLDKCDKNGDLPLHVAAKSPTHKILYIPSSSTKPHCFRCINKSVLEILVDANPGASKIKNKFSAIPLHLAIKNGKKRKDGIDALLKAYPNSVNVIDIEYNLFPFLLVAAAKCKSSTPAPDTNCTTIHQRPMTSNVDLIFQFLRANPNNIQTDDPRKKKSKKRMRGSDILSGTEDVVSRKLVRCAHESNNIIYK
mmetsp:Transcript_25332/g.31219  ORF Transcript_25332/g.31219 Transcript_25332/m.31219 type:complete len:411 (+) Transcript_25332:28-1260(+)